MPIDLSPVNAILRDIGVTNSGMSQNADGSIGFMVGNSPNSSMKFFVGNPKPASKN